MPTDAKILVDTNVVVAFFRGEEQLHPRFKAVELICLPWIVLGELHFGAQRSTRREREIANIKDLLLYAGVVFPNQETTATYGQLRAELTNRGQIIPENDIWIAAVALQYGLPLATRDGHFDYVPGLRTLAW